MGDGTAWTNIPFAVWKFLCKYMRAEKLTNSNGKAKLLALYCFYGKYYDIKNKKDYSIIRAIHLKLTNGRRRFTKGIQEVFHDFFKLLADQPQLQSFLEDGGVGKPPPEYMVAVEKGLRNMGKNVRTCVICNTSTCVVRTCVLVFD